MPGLNVPEENAGSNTQPLSIGDTAEKVASGAEIGKVQQYQGAKAIETAAQIGQTTEELGNWMGARGNQMLGAGLKQMEGAISNIVSASAIKDYNKQAGEKASIHMKPVDQVLSDYEQMNKFKDPSALAGELEHVKNQVVEKYAPAIDNPEDRQQFTQQMTDLNDNHKVLAVSAQRQQQGELANKALQEAVNTDISSGILDQPENINYYASLSLNRITKAMDNGTISSDQAGELGEQVRKGLYVGSLQTLNSTNPMQLEQLLNAKSPNELNINDLEYQQLRKQNFAAMADVQSMDKVQYQATKEIENAQTQFTYNSLQSGIENGTVKSSDLYSIYDDGKITYPQFEKLAESYLKGQKKTNDTWHTRSEISAAVANKEILANFSPKQIDDHFQNYIRGLSKDGMYNSVPMQTKVDVARSYMGPIPSLEKEIKYSMASGDMQKVQEAVVAYDKLMKNSPLTLSELNKDTKMSSYISGLHNLYTSTSNMNKEAAQGLYDSIYKVDSHTHKKRESDFLGADAFTDDNIKKTIAGLYDRGDPWYRGADSVSDEMVSIVKPLLQQAYMTSGDVQTSLDTVKNQTKTLIGHTDVNTTPKWGIDSGSIVAFPPENFSNIPADKLRTALNQEITGHVPEGVDPNSVMIGSDELTSQQVRDGKNPSYFLYYMDKNGQETMLDQRWTVDSKTKGLVSQNNLSSMDAKANPEAKTAAYAQEGAPSDGSQPIEQASQLTPTQQKQHASMSKILGDTNGYGKSPIMSPEFIDNVAKSSLVRQIASHYPGPKEAQAVVNTAINSMVGKDTDPWRVSQSLKLINSVLVNNSSPNEFLKFGTATTRPALGNIVVTKGFAGLFGGMVQNGDMPMVQILRMDGKSLTPTYLPLSQVLGFRQLPTPENFSKQSQILTSPNIERWNPYTMSKDKSVVDVNTRFNFATGQTYKENGESKGFNPYTGTVNDSMGEQLKNAGKGTAPNENKYSVGVSDQAPGDYSISNESSNEVTTQESLPPPESEPIKPKKRGKKK